ncbi:MAG: PD40 domain-containing protein [Anaerolineae bacterium]|nr:PD40 domain-containing protein [Anaerolineae bacterium]
MGRRVSTQPSAENPAWSPDGTRIAYGRGQRRRYLARNLGHECQWQQSTASVSS